MPNVFQYDVFLSHNQADKPRVRRLAERLRAAGLRLWFDERVIQPGDDIYLAIERGLEASRTLVLCLSPMALGSDWVGLERSTVLFRDPAYAYGKDHDLQKYLDFVTAQITELLTHYGPIAAIWLDGIATPNSRPAKVGDFHCQELYDRIHRLQPQVLVSYKQGLLGRRTSLRPSGYLPEERPEVGG